jgi:hypothetical protein
MVRAANLRGDTPGWPTLVLLRAPGEKRKKSRLRSTPIHHAIPAMQEEEAVRIADLVFAAKQRSTLQSRPSATPVGLDVAGGY